MPTRPPKHPNRPVLCPQCKTAIKTLVASVQDMPERGSLYLCGVCACLSEFTRFGLHKLSQRQIDALEPEEREELAFAARNILARAQHQGQI